MNAYFSNLTICKQLLLRNSQGCLVISPAGAYLPQHNWISARLSPLHPKKWPNVALQQYFILSILDLKNNVIFWHSIIHFTKSGKTPNVGNCTSTENCFCNFSWHHSSHLHTLPNLIFWSNRFSTDQHLQTQSARIRRRIATKHPLWSKVL